MPRALLEAEALGERSPERGGAVEQAAERAAAAGGAEPDREVDLRAQGAAALELGAVFGEVRGRSARRWPWRGSSVASARRS